MSDVPHRLHELLRLPLRRGRLLWTPDTGDAYRLLTFRSHLEAHIFRADGREEHRDLGSGLVTNVGVMNMANDFAWSAQLNLATLALANNHATGTGSTAAAATDIACQTLAAPTTATAVVGTQSLVSAANSQTYKTSGTINYTSSLAITEWGLHSLATLSSTTGSPFTASG